MLLNMKLTAVLLAGGRSLRMGRDKAWLNWRGSPLWRSQRDKLISLKPEQFFISCRPEQGFEACGHSLIYDPPDSSSPLEAIANCLQVMNNPILVLAVDLPNMVSAVVAELAEHHEQSGRGAVFAQGAMFEPLCALYPPAMLGLMQEAAAKRRYALQDVVRAGMERGLMDSLPLPAEYQSAFFNANTPEEWTQAQPPP